MLKAEMAEHLINTEKLGHLRRILDARDIWETKV
jgi:hypothetical protein